MGKQISGTTAVVVIVIVVLVVAVVGWQFLGKKDKGTAVDESRIDQPMMLNPGTPEAGQAPLPANPDISGETPAGG